MTYQSTATDTPYTGNLYNLNPNVRSILSILKASLKAAGFVVTKSGDGLATYSSSADILTNENLTDTTVTDPASNDGTTFAKIANSICNNRAWFIVKPNASATFTGEWCIQLISFQSTISLRVKFSPGGFAGGSATQTPAPTTASDEKYNCGGGTNASPTGTAFTTGGDGSFRCNTTFDNAVATPRGWFGMWNNTTDTCCLMFIWDFVNNFGGTDTYPYLTSVKGNTGGNDAAAAPIVADQTTQQNTNGWVTKRGTGIAEYTSALYPAANGLPANGTVASLGVNTLGSLSDLMPVMYARCGFALGSPLGWKGTSTMIRWKPTARPNADHYDAPVGGSTRDFVVVQDLALPWAVSGTACIR